MQSAPPGELPVGRLQLMEVVDMLLDIAQSRSQRLGPDHTSVGDAAFVTALALIQLEERERAGEQLELARAGITDDDMHRRSRLDMARVMLNAISAQV